MANKMSICIIKYTYTQYVGVDIEKYTVSIQPLFWRFEQ